MSETPSSVFWIRRAVVLVALFAIIGLIGFGVTALFNATETTEPVEQTEMTEPVDEEQEQEIGECLPGTIEVTAAIGNAEGETSEDIQVFQVAELPHMWYTITNNSGVDCRFDVGSAVTFFEITSGSDLIWTSKDCDRRNDENENGVLKAGVTLTSPPVPWEKVRSSGTGCGAGQTDVITGGASYWLSVEVNGVFSDEDSNPQFLLY